ncbi:MAG: hypothetical protein BWY87_01696 [Deltaproteobacteria bacterium ADurb.Bin510]|nr:MAG: hypothetical protein BWY87_01696 [Deltaproteobacteria bacterium ADurb.Bin510]
MTKLRDKVAKKVKVAVYEDYFAPKPGQAPAAEAVNPMAGPEAE